MHLAVFLNQINLRSLLMKHLLLGWFGKALVLIALDLLREWIRSK
jgi:hypothetical protein